MAVAFLNPADQRPGWMTWTIGAADHFVGSVLGTLFVRAESDGCARVRLEPLEHHRNVNGVYHGGAILSLIDSAIFPATMLLTGKTNLNVATIDLQTQFVAPGDLTRPLDALVTLTRETGRMTFTRGLVVQDDDVVASFTALQRKIAG